MDWIENMMTWRWGERGIGDIDVTHVLDWTTYIRKQKLKLLNQIL